MKKIAVLLGAILIGATTSPIFAAQAKPPIKKASQPQLSRDDTGMSPDMHGHKH